MKLIVCIVLFCFVLNARATKKSLEKTDNIPKTSLAGGFHGFGLELLLTKLNYIDRKLMRLDELESELHQHRQQMEHNKPSEEKTSTTTTKVPRTTATPPQPMLLSYSSCKVVPSNASGVYLIRINNTGAPFKVWCEQMEFGGGWIVIQHRFDGSVDFNRKWSAYRDGFGELEKEFWLGLELVHQLTTARKYELLVEVKDFNGTYGYARYNSFQVGSESEHYSLKTLGTYSGTAGDSLSSQSLARKFSTMDRPDNDDSYGIYSAVYWGGAWWYGTVNYANLNGRYMNAVNEYSNWWYYFKHNFQGLSFTRMMIRAL